VSTVYIRGHNARGNKNALGIKRSPETKAKMSEAQRKRQGPSLERFWQKVNKEGPVPELRPELGQCWVWTGSHSWNGYGQFEDGRAHVFAYEQFVGPVPRGKEIDHKCRTRDCVRYDHLEAVSHRENVKRAYKSRKLENSWMEDSSTW
jgi:hypothetical protein